MLLPLPDDPPSCDILQHVTQSEEDPPHSFQLAGCFRHRVLVQDLLLHTQTKNYTRSRKKNLWLVYQQNVKYLLLDATVSSEVWTTKRNEWMNHWMFILSLQQWFWFTLQPILTLEQTKTCHFKDECYSNISHV